MIHREVEERRAGVRRHCDAQRVVDEWRAVDFSQLGAFEIVLLLGLGLALLSGTRLPLMRVASPICESHFGQNY